MHALVSDNRCCPELQDKKLPKKKRKAEASQIKQVLTFPC